ncbi:DUF6377 domain-containing protein [Thermophagus sp. OGC60D27]|uniref:DUF6377 domain-containing protein n=1 Tax=Thermophagus sp. OGC60D27 TaxID=3458415 RepID=UPI004037B595
MLCILIFFLFLTAISSFGQNNVDELFIKLDEVIEQKDQFELEKIHNIKVLTQEYSRTDSTNLNERFILTNKLHQSYFTFHYDSAVFYSRRMLKIANKIGKSDYINYSRLKIIETLLASGLFSIVKDSLKKVSTASLSDSLRVKYYYLKARLYIDMANYYQRPYYTHEFRQKVTFCLDSAISITNAKTPQYYSLKGLQNIWLEQYGEARRSFLYLFENFEIDGRQFAVDASTFAFVYNCLGEPEKELEWLLKAAIRDIKFANKEYVALRIIANRLFSQGQIKKSSHYLNIAINDAQSYGAIQRVFQISQIQPLVEAARLDLVEKQKLRLKVLVFAITFLFLLLIAVLVLLFKQYYRIKLVKDELDKSNKALSESNTKLREVNLIKEEYIAFFFKTNSDLIEKLDEYRQTIDNKLAVNKINQIRSIITRADIKREREALFRDFDTGFLNIFPDFIKRFNALFKEGDRELPDNSKHLNTNLRIFALIRLGITETDKIAHILNYSVNTINTYKTKIKNRSVVPNDEFEKEILKIQSV